MDEKEVDHNTEEESESMQICSERMILGEEKKQVYIVPTRKEKIDSEQVLKD